MSLDVFVLVCQNPHDEFHAQVFAWRGTETECVGKPYTDYAILPLTEPEPLREKFERRRDHVRANLLAWIERDHGKPSRVVDVTEKPQFIADLGDGWMDVYPRGARARISRTG